MSEGPIKAWRDSHKPQRISTSSAKARHGFRSAKTNRAYCGRKASTIVSDWADVTCADCLAAREADRG